MESTIGKLDMMGTLFDENKIVNIYKRERFGFDKKTEEIVMKCKNKHIVSIIKNEKKISHPNLDSMYINIDRGYKDIILISNTVEWTFHYTILSTYMMGGGQLTIQDFPSKLRDIKLKDIDGTES